MPYNQTVRGTVHIPDRAAAEELFGGIKLLMNLEPAFEPELFEPVVV
jgi:hypothetical protein